LRRVYARAVRLRTQLLVLLAAFAGATAIAELAGAENLGTALAFGQMAFMIALVAIMLRS
jgi:superfamily II helicase